MTHTTPTESRVPTSGSVTAGARRDRADDGGQKAECSSVEDREGCEQPGVEVQEPCPSEREDRDDVPVQGQYRPLT